jgi:integrase
VRLKRGGFAPETIRGLYTIFASMMKLAQEEGIISRSPCRRVELPSHVRDEQRYLTTDEVERLAQETPDRYRAVIYVGAYLALRWQEVAGLKRTYVDLRRHPPRFRSSRPLSELAGETRWSIWARRKPHGEKSAKKPMTRRFDVWA